MSYLDSLPSYVYELPCDHDFPSFTRSIPDEDDGMHWFWCVPCKKYRAVLPDHLVERQPCHPSGMRMSDNQLVVRINAAIQKDRVKAYYLTHWDSVGIRDVSKRLGVQRSAVEAVAADLGVYNGDYSGRVT
jgi:hypothetical protein